MTLVIPPNHYHVAFAHTLAGSLHEHVTTCGFKYNENDFEDDVDALAEGWIRLMAGLNKQWKFDSIDVRSAQGTVYEKGAIGAVGALDVFPSTSQNSFLLKKITGAPGRRYRGRMFVPGVCEDDVDQNGNVSAGALARLQANLNDCTQVWAAGHWSVVLLHNKLPDDIGDPQPTPLTDLRWHSKVGVQNRRFLRR